jgi:hypothetical protein
MLSKNLLDDELSEKIQQLISLDRESLEIESEIDNLYWNSTKRFNDSIKLQEKMRLQSVKKFTHQNKIICEDCIITKKKSITHQSIQTDDIKLVEQSIQTDDIKLVEQSIQTDEIKSKKLVEQSIQTDEIKSKKLVEQSIQTDEIKSKKSVEQSIQTNEINVQTGKSVIIKLSDAIPREQINKNITKITVGNKPKHMPINHTTTGMVNQLPRPSMVNLPSPNMVNQSSNMVNQLPRPSMVNIPSSNMVNQSSILLARPLTSIVSQIVDLNDKINKPSFCELKKLGKRESDNKSINYDSDDEILNKRIKTEHVMI